MAKIPMATATTLRLQIESALADRIPSALTPRPQAVRPLWSTGIASVDELLGGGLPVGALTELSGSECSGRTSLAFSFLATATLSGRVAAWIDVTDSLQPESAAAAGVCLERLLWVRCGVSSMPEPKPVTAFHLQEKYFAPPQGIKGLHGGGCGAHPRGEVKGLAGAVGEWMQSVSVAPRCAEPQRREKTPREHVARIDGPQAAPVHAQPSRPPRGKPWSRMEQAMRATDLLLQTGGFGVIVLDMGSLPREAALRVPLSTWFRYRAAAERAQACVLLLSQSPCAKSSAGLLLRMQQARELGEEPTVFTGLACSVETMRERFQTASKIVPLRRPPQRETGAGWQARSAWAGAR